VGNTFGVGRAAPQFDLTAHDGSRVSLRQYRGDWFAVVVFLGTDQAAAAAETTALSAVADQLWGMHGQLIGLLHGDEAALQAVAAKAEHAAFPLLADPDAGVARSYGFFDAASGQVRLAAVIVDRSGKIAWSADGGPVGVDVASASVDPDALVNAMRDVAR
jgi:peroxiredoxin